MEWIDSSDAEAFGKLPRRSQREAAFDVVLAAAKAEKRRATAFYEKHLVNARCLRCLLRYSIETTTVFESGFDLGG